MYCHVTSGLDRQYHAYCQIVWGNLNSLDSDSRDAILNLGQGTNYIEFLVVFLTPSRQVSFNLSLRHSCFVPNF
jgi:hypothetical protein